MKAMILAAGLGTRLKPFTEKQPKALFPINGKTLLQRNIEYLQNYGFDNVIVNVHHFANQIIEEIKNNNGWGSNVIISDETNEVLETGGGLKKSAHFFKDSNEPFVLMNADMLTDLNIENMLANHTKHNPLATLAVTNRGTSRYFLFDENNILCGWLNEKTGEQKGKFGTKKAFSGIHLISPKIFSLIIEEGKFSMVDLYLRLSTTHTIMAFDHSNGKLIDVGKPESKAIAENLFL
ncbi:MAG: nucleotidyltransferase family protein [Ferruginibacter sp.]|nr:nucleotidyltransferase family protein [Ferruginibacter sp.]NOU38863.1 nucleotidyltransferase family protein [Ferruginibacter sp.]